MTLGDLLPANPCWCPPGEVGARRTILSRVVAVRPKLVQGLPCAGDKLVLFDTLTFLLYRGKSPGAVRVFECDSDVVSERISTGRTSTEVLTHSNHQRKHVTNAGVTCRGRE